MIRCLFLAIFITCLALPAIAAPACHETTSAVTAVVDHAKMDHSKHHQGKAPKQSHQLIHGCIGCSLPPQIQFSSIDAMQVAGERLLTIFEQTMLATVSGPDTPPPRKT
jgi:hypothetical protein